MGGSGEHGGTGSAGGAPETPARRGIRWWPATAVLGLGAAALAVVWLDPSRSHQQRNLTALATVIFVVPLVLAWWGLLSRAPIRARAAGVGGFAGLVAVFFALFRVSGVSGDLRPIFSWRWRATTSAPAAAASAGASRASAPFVRADYPQFLGPQRDGHVRGIELATGWATNGPVELWRRPVGAAWSGFVVSGGFAVTMEQDGEEEVVSAWRLESGERAWSARTPGRHHTTIGGEGPRSTPLIAGGRVYALGATGTLSCLGLSDGKVAWRVSLTELAKCGVPEWGFASAPLWLDGKVVVLAGGEKAAWAFDGESGKVAWSAGTGGANYGSAHVVEWAGGRVLTFFAGRAWVALDPADGSERWRHPFGAGMPLVAAPVLVASNRVVLSAGYGVGAEAVEWTGQGVRTAWSSKKLKAKFANPVGLDGIVCGLDDGILAAVDAATGAGLWKEGRWGHGQGVVVGRHYLLVAETGDLVLLEPTRSGPGELGRRKVLEGKTWNPVALAGDLLLVRNDREAACLRLPLVGPSSQKP